MSTLKLQKMLVIELLLIVVWWISGHSPSPFSSAQSSLRTTPDPYSLQPESFSTTPEPTPDLGFKYGGSSASADAIWMTQGRPRVAGDIPWGLQKGESTWRPPMGVSPDRNKGHWPPSPQPPPHPIPGSDVPPNQYQNNIQVSSFIRLAIFAEF